MVKKKECYTKKTKTGKNYTTCVEGQKKPKRKRRTKAQMAAARAMAAQDKPAPKAKAKPTAKGIKTIQKKIKTTRKLKNKSTIKPPLAKSKAKAKPKPRMLTPAEVIFGKGGLGGKQKGITNIFKTVKSYRKGMKRNYTAQQIKDIVDNNILKLYTKNFLDGETSNLEQILQDSMVNEAENSYWGTQGFDDADDEKITTKSGRMDWYDAMAIPSMKAGNEFKVMYPLLIGWLSMDKYKNDNDVLKAMAKLIENLLTDTGESNLPPMFYDTFGLQLRDEPFYYPQSKDRRIGSDKWESFMEGQYTRYVKKIKISKKHLALGRLFRGIMEGHKFNIAGSNIDKLVKIELDDEWNSKMLVYTPRMVKGKSVMGLGKDAIKLKTLTDYLKKVYSK